MIRVAFCAGFFVRTRRAVLATSALCLLSTTTVAMARAPPKRVGKVVGPLGLEPRTKGFTSAPPFPEGVDYLFTPVGCGTL
jgi:hypothetical protein